MVYLIIQLQSYRAIIK